MHTLFILSLFVLFICYLSRRKLAVLFTKGKNKHDVPPAIPDKADKTVSYRILAYNAKDYESTKELENMMELRLEQCLAGLAKQGHSAEVEFHSTGFVLVYLVKFSY